MKSKKKRQLEKQRGTIILKQKIIIHRKGLKGIEHGEYKVRGSYSWLAEIF